MTWHGLAQLSETAGLVVIQRLALPFMQQWIELDGMHFLYVCLMNEHMHWVCGMTWYNGFLQVLGKLSCKEIPLSNSGASTLGVMGWQPKVDLIRCGFKFLIYDCIYVHVVCVCVCVLHWNKIPLLCSGYIYLFRIQWTDRHTLDRLKLPCPYSFSWKHVLWRVAVCISHLFHSLYYY